MSTFPGLIKEIPGISVDRFDKENLTSSAFFLSHCHTDHMQGLSDTFFENLYRCKKYLYCSPITKAILQKKFVLQDSCVKEININKPVVIEYEVQGEEKSLLSVTCVSAGHCPGSVMFLFERDMVSILYTGDFRINPIDLPKLKALHYNENSKLLPRTFTKIYLDTTFLSKDFPFLPSRKDSIHMIYNVTKEWLNKDPRNLVALKCSALYGYEFLFIELSKILNLKIHVKDDVYDSYCRIPELSEHITNLPNSTRVHACIKRAPLVGLCRKDVPDANVMTVILSVIKWRKKDTSLIGEWDEVLQRTFNVCYSNHSSLEELKAFVQYFSTLEIYPCVVPSEQEEEVYSLLNEITKKTNEGVTKVTNTYIMELPSCELLNKAPFKSEYFSSDDDSL